MAGGTPTDETVNALNQVDMYIDYIKVWTCSDWQAGPCKTRWIWGCRGVRVIEN